MKTKLVIITREQSQFEKKVREMSLPNLEVVAPTAEEQILAEVAAADIILGDPPRVTMYLEAARKLKWLQSTFTGVDLLIKQAQEKRFILTNVRDTYSDIMAEYVFAYILMFEKDILLHISSQKEKIWHQKPYKSLSRKTLAILGTGSIGKEIARLGASLRMRVLGLNTDGREIENFDKIYTRESLPEFLSSADYIVSVLPSTKETINFFNQKTFEHFKKSAVFFNIGRGNAVNEKDLEDILKANSIKAAVVDVFQEEPLAQDSPLWSLPNIFITPHISGYKLSERIFDIFKENYLRFNQGHSLNYLVDLEKGY